MLRSLSATLAVALCVSACQEKPPAPPPEEQPKRAPGEEPLPTKTVGDRLCYLRYDNTNINAVANGGVAPVIVLAKRPNLNGCILCQIETYHWNNAAGVVPGAITATFRDPQAPGGGQAAPTTPVGPTTASPGQGGAPNVNWAQNFNGPFIPDGSRIDVVDSDPATWSQNAGSGGKGFTKIWCEAEL